jgi:hypothetical protein
LQLPELSYPLWQTLQLIGIRKQTKKHIKENYLFRQLFLFSRCQIFEAENGLRQASQLIVVQTQPNQKKKNTTTELCFAMLTTTLSHIPRR